MDNRRLGGHVPTQSRNVAAASGALVLAPHPFQSWPFGTSTNDGHARMTIGKAGSASTTLPNCCQALGSIAAATRWGYNGMAARLRRAAQPAAGGR